MTESSELPLFPTTAPALFRDPQPTGELFAAVLSGLAEVVDVDADQVPLASPCSQFTVGELRTHVLGWLQFFATALMDPKAAGRRPDPDAFVLLGGMSASDVVLGASADIARAIDAGVAGEVVSMSQARMAGDGVLAMALGEYIIYAWDLATSTGRAYSAPDEAILPAHEFLRLMVAPECRGPESGFFDAEVAVSVDASPLHKLLGFAGRDPLWTPPAR